MWNKRTVLACAAVAALVLAGCSSGKKATTTPSGGTSGAAITGNITVLAASSLTGTFTKLGQEFEAAHPGTKVTFSFGASSTLAQQIVQGAPADVFASASDATMKTVTDANAASGSPTVFVKNQLVIIVPRRNPKNITSLADLTKPGLKVVECAKGVPCGDAAVKALAAANLTLTPVSFAPDVKSALSTVELGEADAALVYRTDAIAAGDKVRGIEFPESTSAITNYPIVALAHSSNMATARAFVAFVLSPNSIAELVTAGFQKP
jgi:molybdate transport system substrate-binding protein